MDLDGSIYRITTIFFSITDRKRGRKRKEREKQKGGGGGGNTYERTVFRQEHLIGRGGE